MGPEDQTLVVRLGSMCLWPRNNLTCPSIIIIFFFLYKGKPTSTYKMLLWCQHVTVLQMRPMLVSDKKSLFFYTNELI